MSTPSITPKLENPYVVPSAEPKAKTQAVDKKTDDIFRSRKREVSPEDSEELPSDVEEGIQSLLKMQKTSYQKRNLPDVDNRPFQVVKSLFSTYYGQLNQFGRFDGEGTFSNKHGVFEGNFNDGQIQTGNYTSFNNGIQFKGSWKNGKWDNGTLHIPGYGSQEGKFENNKLVEGTITLLDSTEIKGKFHPVKNGIFANATVRFPNKDAYKGGLKISGTNVFPHGDGIYTFANGQIYGGQFENGFKVYGNNLVPIERLK